MTRWRKAHLRRKKGNLVDTVMGCLCLSIIIFSSMSVVSWVHAAKMKSQTLFDLTYHNVNCMERLEEEARLSGNELLNEYNSDQFSSLTVDTTVTCFMSSVDDVSVYTVTINSKDISTGFYLKSRYVMTNLVQDSFTPEVNPE